MKRPTLAAEEAQGRGVAWELAQIAAAGRQLVRLALNLRGGQTSAAGSSMHELLKCLGLRRLGLLFSHVPGHGARLGLDQNGLRACSCTHRGEFMHACNFLHHLPLSKRIFPAFRSSLRCYTSVPKSAEAWRRVGPENVWYRQDPVENVVADTKTKVFVRTHNEEKLAHLSAQRRSTGTARDRGGSGCLCAACGVRGAMSKPCRDSRPRSKTPCSSSSAPIV